MNDHYTLENLKRALRHPVLIRREAHRLASWPLHRAYGWYTDRTCGDGVAVMETDWDTLVILDACRYDAFAEQNPIDGTLHRVTSRGKKSWDFIRENFVGETFHDTVYVTANPFSTDLEAGTFHHVAHLHLDRWDEEIGTVRPGAVVEAARAAHERFPNKRLIVHFMQPHRPYLGETAAELRRRLDLQGYGSHDRGIQIWGAVKQREVTIGEVRRAYAESLEIALEHVEDLLETVPGRAVVTADHGEMLGERALPVTTRVWGHMEGFSTPTLRTVPWLVVEGDTRREIHSGSPVEADREPDEDVIADRLATLGYAE